MTDQAAAIEIGHAAPAITLPRDGGGETSLSDFLGKRVVVYFYPRDDTPGCTIEAVEFSGELPAFASAETVVIGISKDSVKSHDKFRDKHQIGVILLSDEAGDVAERYGVWGEKSMYGKTFMGIERATFLIDREGRIARIWRNVKVAGHADEVLAAARVI
ncbi:thioredoxin-dependent thiol peroxidase [uncultured Amaricoccus sp.]|uniref:thioredoxin-dependent thiol peroxidase n=1 Tax=uncultured Amaricoccus sp. TaxID=339341 RepID=UPI00260D0A1B|nr:thioredoxin-dependent thiol peroxidase [uncultured Amaricoccus sp.]